MDVVDVKERRALDSASVPYRQRPMAPSLCHPVRTLSYTSASTVSREPLSHPDNTLIYKGLGKASRTTGGCKTG